MAKGGLVFTKDNEYYTPLSVVRYFGEFDYDPATVPQKAAELGIPHYDTIETDGLAQDWTKYRRIWINPPFTRKHEFLAKAVETYRIAKNEIYVLFPIEFLTTRRFYEVCGGGRIYVPSGRINFQSGLGKKGKSPAFGSCVLKIQEESQIIFIDINDLK
jgi:phage N-6-adenine-methyltransferase